MEGFKHLIDVLAKPTILVTFTFVIFFFIFPPSDWFDKWHRRLKFDTLWGKKSLIIITGLLIAFFVFGLGDPDFRSIVLKPDNVPISGLIFLVFFFTWLSMSQAYKNDELQEAGKPVDEHYDAPNDKVLVWPDLVYVELISLILCSAFFLLWSIGLAAPLEEPANPSESPNPAKAPWYFLGLQELLTMFHPMVAGVTIPGMGIFLLILAPFMDNNPEGSGYYSYKNRKLSIAIFMFGWLVLWVLLIVIGTFLRGPNWNFFGPFEYWDSHKVEALTNVNFSEFIYVKWMGTGLPGNILLREIWGIIIILGYFMVLPPLLAKTWLKDMYAKLGVARYSIFIVLIIAALTLPIKMYLRWMFNLKYIISIPEYFFNF
jgi:hypothetical protein